MEFKPNNSSPHNITKALIDQIKPDKRVSVYSSIRIFMLLLQQLTELFIKNTNNNQAMTVGQLTHPLVSHAQGQCDSA